MRAVPPDDAVIRERIAEARQLSVAAPILLPMLERRKRMAYQSMLADYRDGRIPSHNHIATMFVIESIMSEIHSKLNDLNMSKE